MKLLFENWRKYLNENMNLITQAFENTDPEYLMRSIKQRTPGPESAGSVFSQPTGIEDLINAPWEEQDWVIGIFQKGSIPL